MSCSRKSVILGIVCFFAASSLQAEEIQWRADYAAARQEARESNRPLLMDFGTANCTWCKKLDASTFRDPAVIKQINEQFIAVKVDADKSRELTTALNIDSFPTLVFAAPDGKILGMQKGFVEAAAFNQQLRHAHADSVAHVATAAPKPAVGVDVAATPAVLAVRITAPPVTAPAPKPRATVGNWRVLC